MKKIKFLPVIYISIIIFAFTLHQVSAQDTIVNYKVIHKMELHKQDLGVGLGLDYGGILGAKCSFIPLPFVSVFGSVGLQVGGVGWNTGITWHILPVMSNYAFRPNIKLMYGINSAILVVGKSKYTQQFTGFTPGIGMEMRFGKHKRSGLDIDLNVPLRSPEFWSHWNEVKDDPDVEDTNEPLPVALSIGFHREF